MSSWGRRRMKIALRNDLGELGRLASELEAFAGAHGLPDATLMALNLALEELVTNTMSYGFTGGEAQTIDVSLTLDGDMVRVRVEDTGAPFNPLDQEMPDLDAPLADRPVGGLGIHLVRSVMDEVHYERAGDRNIVSLAKRVDGGATA